MARLPAPFSLTDIQTSAQTEPGIGLQARIRGFFSVVRMVVSVAETNQSHRPDRTSHDDGSVRCHLSADWSFNIQPLSTAQPARRP